MVHLKDGPKLVIDHMIMYQLLSEDAFWDTVPAGMDRREEGKAAAQKALAIAMGRTCAGCTSIKSAVAPLHNWLWRGVAAAQANAPDTLEPLCGFLSLKRGYRPRPIVVYYVDGAGRTQELKF